jgi:ParB-like chromosome segregation protein Spo0J
MTRKAGHVRLSPVPLSYLRPSPENESLYRPVTKDDPDIIALADSIREIGVKEPIVMSKDGYILSGHRRFVAAGVAGLTEVPCRIEDVRHDDDPDRFLTLLREYNRQREKTLEEKLREEVVSADPDGARAEGC